MILDQGKKARDDTPKYDLADIMQKYRTLFNSKNYILEELDDVNSEILAYNEELLMLLSKFLNTFKDRLYSVLDTLTRLGDNFEILGPVVFTNTKQGTFNIKYTILLNEVDIPVLLQLPIDITITTNYTYFIDRSKVNSEISKLQDIIKTYNETANRLYCNLNWFTRLFLMKEYKNELKTRKKLGDNVSEITNILTKLKLKLNSYPISSGDIA